MSAAKSIVSDYLHRLRNQFYGNLGDKAFYQQKGKLTEGICHLANWLEERGARLPERRYRAILDEIIVTIQRFGQPKDPYFCRYWLTAVQSHVDHHGEAYYEEAKSFRYALDNLRGDLNAKQARKVEEARDTTTEELARLTRLVKGGRPKGKKAGGGDQLALF